MIRNRGVDSTIVDRSTTFDPRPGVVVSNISKLLDITVAIGQTDPEGDVSPLVDITVPSTKTVSLDKNFDGGSAMLFVWNYKKTKLLWKGIVPEDQVVPIIIYPGALATRVSFDGIELPSYSDSTDEIRYSNQTREEVSSLDTRYIFVVLLGIMLIVIIYKFVLVY